jgi:transposase-like protein
MIDHVKNPKTPPCPICGSELDVVINSKVVIGWRCMVCNKAISIERVR